MRVPGVLLLAGLVACGPEPGLPSPEVAPVEIDAAAAPADSSPGHATTPQRPRGGPGCIRSGSTREEVRAVMGEPDSVSFGAWLYGRSSVTFGYGTVLTLENEGGELIVC